MKELPEPPDGLDPVYLDNVLAKISNARPSKLRTLRDDLQLIIDRLDNLLKKTETYDEHFVRCFRRLQVLCRTTNLRPSSSILDAALEVELVPVSQTASSDIYSGRYGHQRVAVKAVRVLRNNLDRIQKAYYDELILWGHLCRHPNIVPLIGTYSSDTLHFCLVSKWMTNDTAKTYLIKHPDANRSKLIAGTIHGLEFMHSLSLVHGDIKASNVLVDEYHNACLGDFGITTMPDSSVNLTYSDSLKGTLRWMSPESFQADKISDVPRRLTQSSDIWSLAMFIWEVYSGRVPFDHLSEGQIMLAIMQGKHQERPKFAHAIKLTDAMWKLLIQCWTLEPEGRPSLAELAPLFEPPALNSVSSMLAIIEGSLIDEMETDLIQQLVQGLDQALEDLDEEDVMHKRALTGLRKICRRTKILPKPCYVERRGALSFDVDTIIQGPTADIYKGTYQRHAVAVKVVRLRLELRSRIIQECFGLIVLLRHLHHPGIVPMLGATSRFPIGMVSQWMLHGPVIPYLCGHPTTNRLQLMSDIIAGLSFMHSIGLIHADLKAGNVLVDETRHARLTGWHTITIVDTARTASAQTSQSIRWSSPELLDPETDETDAGDAAVHTVESDIYALAMVFLELFTGTVPFPKYKRDYVAISAIMRGERPHRPKKSDHTVGLSDALWGVIESCWSQHPESRPALATVAATVEEALISTSPETTS